MARTRDARKDARYTMGEIAALLSEAVGRPIAEDTYRKWEKEALIPHDLIIPFCDLCDIDPYELLTGEQFTIGRVRAKKKAA